MVMRWGMSDKVGSVDYSEAHSGYTGQTAGFSVSAATKELIESEVRSLIEEGYNTARRILLEKNEDFERLAKGLLEYETLTGDQIRKIIAGEKLTDDDDDSTPDKGNEAPLTAIPKTKKPKTPKGGLEPEPTT